jgi:two-component system osmolarity sensor histidine kinase EnvZ
VSHWKNFKAKIKSILPTSLFGRTIMIIIVPLILLQLTATIVFFDRHWVKMTDRLSAAVAGELASVADIIDLADADIDVIEGITYITAENLEIVLRFYKGDKINTPYESMIWPGLRRNLSVALKKEVGRPFDVRVDFRNKQIDVWIQLEQGVLHAIMPERRLYSSSGYIFILWLIGLSIIFFAISVWLMRNQIRPIHRLASAANRLGRGQDVSFFKPTGAREVRQAAESFLKMRERIQRQIEQRTSMLAGVSHDLRTPITRLKLQLEMMADMPPLPDDIKEMRRDLTEMEDMINAYLAFAKGLEYEDTIQINLGHFINDLAAKAQTQDKDIILNIPEHQIDIEGRIGQLSRAINNIIGNALKFADKLEITLYKDEDNQEAVIEFCDNGSGMDEEEFERVFRPFYRIETSRNKKTGGVGLGLSIAQDIIHSHGGSITLSNHQSNNFSGLKATIKLPL